jgi:hypothetical protein
LPIAELARPAGDLRLDVELGEPRDRLAAAVGGVERGGPHHLRRVAPALGLLARLPCTRTDPGSGARERRNGDHQRQREREPGVQPHRAGGSKR